MASIIFAAYPNVRGFGYALIQLPERLLDHGVASVRPMSNDALVRRIARQIDHFRPDVVVLRQAEGLPPSAKRITNAINRITELAIERGIPVRQYSKEQVRFVFERFGAVTNYEIARKLAEWIEGLEGIEIRPLKSYEPEAYYQGIFDALALAVCYGYMDM